MVIPINGYAPKCPGRAIAHRLSYGQLNRSGLAGVSTPWTLHRFGGKHRSATDARTAQGRVAVTGTV
jgi:hypothetical protein